MDRKAIQTRVRELAEQLNIPRPKLNQSNAVLRDWIEEHPIEVFNLQKLIDEKAFQEIFNEVLGGRLMTLEQSTNIINSIIADGKYIITFNNTYFPVNAYNTNLFKFILQNGFIKIEDDELGSDHQRDALLEPITEVEVEKLAQVQNLNRDADGAFFNRLNKHHDIINLERYQIYPTSRPSENCLIHSLILSGKFSESTINAVKLSLSTGVSIAKKSLHKIADIIQHTIIVNEWDEPNRHLRPHRYGKHTDTVSIALYDSHYFLMEETNYTNYSVINCENLRDTEDWFDTYRPRHKNKNKSKISSLALVVLMDECEYFYRGDMSAAPESADNRMIKGQVFLGNISNEQRPVPPREIKPNLSKRFYADCESFVSNGKHSLFLLGFTSEEKDAVHILNFANLKPKSFQNTISTFLNTMTDDGTNNATVYFHNLKYDYALLEPYLNIQSTCKKDNNLYSVKVIYKNKQIEFRDSFKIAPMSLSKFCKNFELPEGLDKMDAINYSYYTPENATDTNVSTEMYSKGLKNDELETFRKNTNNAKSFNPIAYYIEYLEMDCKVLKQGMIKFNNIIMDIDERLSIHNSLTISSLTDLYMNINGAYDGVFEQTGNLRDYISKAIYGGRVQANPKYIKKTITEKIADYDGVSLYPSAISRLCSQFGLPTGGCVELDISEPLSPSDYAIMTVEITSVGKKQDMPMLTQKNESSLDYINTIPTGVVYIDNYTLQDYVEFHECEYKILQGVVWKSKMGVKNGCMGLLIQSLFRKRLENKEKNPALANILKLMLNSSYGKCITKKESIQNRIVKRDAVHKDPITKELLTTPDGNFKKFVYKNFNTMKTVRIINSKLIEVEQLAVDTSFNRGQVGCAILSISKRIMNEVFNTANTINAPVYYSDTDSIHMNHSDVKRLEEEFYKQYGRDLTGKNLGQFHIDFELKGTVGEVYATRSLFLGKKSYIDHLQGLNSEGEKVEGFHIRLKGITNESIIHHSKEYTDPFEMFKELATGAPKRMILNPFNKDKNSQKVLFQYLPDGGVKTRKTFVREIKF